MGESNIAVRKANRGKVLRLLYSEGAMTRMDIATRLGLSITTVSNIMNELQKSGLLNSQGQKASSGGRKPSVAALRADGRFSLGIHISLFHLRIVLINLGTGILAQERYRIDFNEGKTYWDQVNSYAQNLLKKRRVPKSRFLGFSISIPGLPNEDGTGISFAPSLGIGVGASIHTDWLNIVLREVTIDYSIVRSAFVGDYNGPVSFGNSAALAAKAEDWFRKSDKIEVYLMLSGGVGGAIIANHALTPLLGTHACEFGHICIEDNGRSCPCGHFGCAEMYLSSYVFTGQTGLSLEEYFAQLNSGNTELEVFLSDYMSRLATLLDIIAHSFDRPIVIGGEMAHYLEPHLDILAQKLSDRGSAPLMNRVRFSNYSEFDSALGAALVNIYDFIEAF